MESDEIHMDVEGFTIAPVNLGAPQGMVPFPYQAEGVEAMLQQESTLLADEMGLGKTIQALLVARSCAMRTLVVCPASLSINWQREKDKWAPEIDLTITTWTKAKDVTEKFDFVILDEAHYAKNQKSIRTQAVKEIVRHAKRSLFLTGTPIMNRPIELYSLLNMAKHPLAANWKNFVTRYCDGVETRHGWDVTGASNLNDLKEKLGSWMLRRTKGEVLKQLPPKTRILSIIENASDRLLALTMQQKILAKEARKSKKRLKEISEQQAEFTKLAEVRAEIALEKAPHAFLEAIDMLDEIGKLIVFWHHKEPLEIMYTRLQTAGIECVKLTGDMNVVERTESVDRFQKGTARVILLTFGVGSEGITLTAASNILMCECEWTPSRLLQAEDRAHRIGQENPVTIRYLVVNDSLDARIAKVAQEKSEMIEEVLDGESFTDI
jgi:SWI/SNF-related matrix-associated actin-dependent regulator 1 of chromatin subfamily A